jgi:iron complex outermembrane receptor protein
MPPMLHNQLRDSAAFNAAERRQVDHNWDYTLLARYAPVPTRDFEIGLARKTRSPNLYERYTWSTWQMAALMNNFVGDGNGYVGDIGLRPEIAHTVNLSADWHAPDRKAWGLRLSPYYTRVKDYIDAVQWDAARNAPRTTPVVDQFTVLKYVNQSARLYGLDLSGFRRFGEPGTGEWVLSGLLNYAVGENRDSGDNLYNIMPPNAKLALTREAGAWSATLEAQFVAAKDEVSRVRNEMETDSYNLLHLRGRYAWKHVRVDIGIENLFDTAHDLPLGGAYLGQGTTMTVGPTGSVPQWGTPVPGPGRSFYVGVNYSF